MALPEVGFSGTTSEVAPPRGIIRPSQVAPLRVPDAVGDAALFAGNDDLQLDVIRTAGHALSPRLDVFLRAVDILQRGSRATNAVGKLEVRVSSIDAHLVRLDPEWGTWARANRKAQRRLAAIARVSHDGRSAYAFEIDVPRSAGLAIGIIYPVGRSVLDPAHLAAVLAHVTRRKSGNLSAEEETRDREGAWPNQREYADVRLGRVWHVRRYLLPRELANAIWDVSLSLIGQEETHGKQ